MPESTLYSVVLMLHALAGTAALASLAVPFLATKGGRLHRRAGWVFAASMGLVSVSAWLLSAFRLFDATPDNDAGALFLGYIGLLSAAAVWMGIRSLRLKRETTPNRRFYDLFWPLALSASALGLGAVGARRGDVLWIVFAALGLFTAVPQLIYWLRAPRGARMWLVQHLSAMGTGGISAVTAFGVVNVDNLGLEAFRLAFWIGPGLIGGLLITWLASRYGKERALLARHGL
jgi:uncharacterized membrane protein